MMKGYYLIACSVHEYRGRLYHGKQIDIRKFVPRQGATGINDDTIDRQEGCVQNQTSDRAVIGRGFFVFWSVSSFDGQMTRGTGSQGSSVQDNVPCRDSEYASQVIIGSFNVTVAMIFRRRTCGGKREGGEYLLPSLTCYFSTVCTSSWRGTYRNRTPYRSPCNRRQTG